MDAAGLSSLAVLRLMGLPSLQVLVQLAPDASLKDRSAAKKRAQAAVAAQVPPLLPHCPPILPLLLILLQCVVVCACSIMICIANTIVEGLETATMCCMLHQSLAV